METKYTQTQYKNILVGDDGKIYTSFYGKPYREKSLRYIEGFWRFTIKINGHKKKISATRTIAEALIPNPDNKEYVKHKDGNKKNNTPSNIYWTDSKYSSPKSTVNKTVGDFKVVSDDYSKIKLQCKKCGYSKKVSRGGITTVKSECPECKDYSLKIENVILAEGFEKWYPVKEYGTEQERSLTNKSIVIKCSCCGQEDIITYPKVTKNRKIPHKCDRVVKIHRKIASTYRNMVKRCTKEEDANYHNYGGRGISVCEEWLESSLKFREWAMESGIELHLTLDREDNNKGYNPDNCRWITRKEQCRNTRYNVLNEEIVKKIKYTDWKDKSTKDITISVGLDASKSSAVYSVLNNWSWTDI